MAFEYKTQPMSQQRAALNKFATGHPQRLGAGALFMEQGTGKTFVYLVDAAWRYEQGEIDTLIIVSLNDVHRQIIEQEVPRHVPDRIKYEANAYRAGLVNRELWNSLQRTNKLVIIAFNIETLSSKVTMKNIERCFFVEEALGGKKPRPKRPRKVMVVIDESHEIRTPSAKRTRNAWKIGERAVVKRIGTGTEIGSGWENLYAQFRFLDWRIIGCQTYTAFKTQYCVTQQVTIDDDHKFDQIKGYKNTDELMKRIAPYVFVCEKKDCMDLPPQHFLDNPPRIVHLLPEQRRLMQELKDNFVVELASGEIVEAPLAISRLQKFQQIAAGHIQLANKVWKPVPNGSLDAALNIAEQCRGQFLLWAQWQPDIIQVAEVLKRAGCNALTYFGGNSAQVNEENKARFKAGKAQGFLVTYGKGAAGLDFPGVSSSVYYTLTFNPIDYWQSLSRNHRKGTVDPVTYHYLHRPGSPDSKLLRTLKMRRAVADLMRDPLVFKQWLSDMLDEDPSHDLVLNPSLTPDWLRLTVTTR